MAEKERPPNSGVWRLLSCGKIRTSGGGGAMYDFRRLMIVMNVGGGIRTFRPEP